MYCKNLLKRHRQTKIVFYCKKNKRYIDISLCNNNCLDFILVRNKTIKKKSDKQKQLEKNRYSIFTNDFTKCYHCHRKLKDDEKFDLHEVYGGSNRTRSIKNGLVVPLCRICHSNEDIINKLRIQLQKEYEKTHTREEFIKIIGKSYIKGDDK